MVDEECRMRRRRRRVRCGDVPVERRHHLRLDAGVVSDVVPLVLVGRQNRGVGALREHPHVGRPAGHGRRRQAAVVKAVARVEDDGLVERQVQLALRRRELAHDGVGRGEGRVAGNGRVEVPLREPRQLRVPTKARRDGPRRGHRRVGHDAARAHARRALGGHLFAVEAVRVARLERHAVPPEVVARVGDGRGVDVRAPHAAARVREVGARLGFEDGGLAGAGGAAEGRGQREGGGEDSGHGRLVAPPTCGQVSESGAPQGQWPRGGSRRAPTWSNATSHAVHSRGM